jgi:hypothetical protein
VPQREQLSRIDREAVAGRELTRSAGISQEFGAERVVACIHLQETLGVGDPFKLLVASGGEDVAVEGGGFGHGG